MSKYQYLASKIGEASAARVQLSIVGRSMLLLALLFSIFGTVPTRVVAEESPVSGGEILARPAENLTSLVTAAETTLETHVLSVGGSYATVDLDNSYISPVVVCSVQYDNNTTPVVARVSGVTSTSFDVRLQNPSDGAVVSDNVSCIIMEEGVWENDGVKIEAQTYLSTVTDHDSSWVGESQSYGQSYTDPVVIGQVMSENDTGWSVFWCSGSSADVPPSATALTTGKTVAEDTDTTRADETVGFIVFEAGHGTIGGVEFEALVGADIVMGVDDSPPYEYDFSTSFATKPEVLVVTQAAMAGANGSWAQTHGSTPASSTSLYLSLNEDQIGDAERNHIAEPVGYVVFDIDLTPDPVDFNIYLGRPTDDSITMNIITDQDAEFYVEYGTSSGSYPSQTVTYNATADEAIEFVIDGLSTNAEIFYRIVYRQTGITEWSQGTEHSFHTQRPPGSSFTFTIISDSHLGQYGGQTADEYALYENTLLHVAADEPDFHLDLGDSFAMDPLDPYGEGLGNGMTAENAEAAYLVERPYMGLISHSIPIFLAIGNHENEEGWNFDDVFDPPEQSLAIVGMRARKIYYPNPIPDDFYTGNADPFPDEFADAYGDEFGDDIYREDYYAWQWGDVLFVVIEPYHYSMTWPNDDGQGYGGEGMDGEVSGDRWDWTLGIDQYLWLKDTLENSDAPYKFIFTHHVTGGATPYGRGGISAAPYFEWGGYNADDTWGWDTERPASAGWDVPIHQLMVNNDVDIFFHGHDHIFAYEELDGIVYLEVPKPDDAGYDWEPYGYGYNEGLYPDGLMIQNSGHIRVDVTPEEAEVSYVRSYLPGDGPDGDIAHSFFIEGGAATSYELTMAVDPAEGGSTTPSVGTHTYAVDQVVSITADPAPGYEFGSWTGGAAEPGNSSTTVTMDSDKTVTAHFNLLAPDAFGKTYPADLASGVSTTPTLGWESSIYADSYEYCIDTTNDNDCDGDAWQDNGADTSVLLVGLANNTTYYWQARANNGGGSTEADSGDWWSFTTDPAGACGIVWSADLEVSDAGVGSETLTFGQGTVATDGLDEGCGEEHLPPVPPAGSFDARFILPLGSDSSFADYRDDSAIDMQWRLEFQPGTGGYPFTFAWDPGALPAGSWRIHDPLDVVVDVNMKVASEYTLTNDGVTALIIEFSEQLCIDVDVVAGWNMTSVPVVADDMTLAGLYPDVSPPAYYFTNAYQPVAADGTLTPGVGYWTYFNEAHTYQICGAIVENKDIPVNAGWNLIGPYEQSMAVAAITSTPVEILDIPVYGFDSAYYDAEALDPGAGYWAYATGAGTLHMNGAESTSTAVVPAGVAALHLGRSQEITAAMTGHRNYGLGARYFAL